MAFNTAKTKIKKVSNADQVITQGPHHRPYLVEEGKQSDYGQPDVAPGHEHLWQEFGKDTTAAPGE